jgi:hypothetical protein
LVYRNDLFSALDVTNMFLCSSVDFWSSAIGLGGMPSDLRVKAWLLFFALQAKIYASEVHLFTAKFLFVLSTTKNVCNANK